MTQKLPVALETLRARLEGYSWAQEAIQSLPSLGEVLQGRSGVLSRITGLASTTLGAVVNVVVVVITGLYLASQPELYSGGIKRLLPFRHRGRAGEVMGVLDEALGRWLLGRFALMILNGGLTAVALWMLGVPLALTGGILVYAGWFVGRQAVNGVGGALQTLEAMPFGWLLLVHIVVGLIAYGLYLIFVARYLRLIAAW